MQYDDASGFHWLSKSCDYWCLWCLSACYCYYWSLITLLTAHRPSVETDRWLAAANVCVQSSHRRSMDSWQDRWSAEHGHEWTTSPDPCWEPALHDCSRVTITYTHNSTLPQRHNVRDMRHVMSQILGGNPHFTTVHGHNNIYTQLYPATTS